MRRLSLCIAICSVALTGCDPKPDPPVETTVATEQLKSVLEAWKRGQPYESLQQRSPPVYFNEPLWRDGATLLDYEIGDVELFGRQGRCTVRLFLRDGNGKQFERKLGYQIDTTPNTVIVRETLGP